MVIDTTIARRTERDRQGRVASVIALSLAVMAGLVIFVGGSAWAQAPGGSRYVQDEAVKVQIGGVWSIRVHSIDVFADRSLRVNLIFSFNGDVTAELGFTDLNQIQLVSDATDERVNARGKPEGPAVPIGFGADGFRFVRNDPIRIAFQFPAFHEPTRTVRLVIYQRAYHWARAQIPDLIIRDIALFAKQ